ncbi:MAG: tetratricopeptide repeat protein [Immundisolibacter sp.]|uniref:tetratricopeptide repeat protein n=1 Tax=Immundisolibacter sp. TaxID=1934948 RepID=UPI003D0FCA24
MTVFWTVAALFVAGALLLVLPPLWAATEPGAPRPWRLSLAIALGLPLVSAAGYLWLGHPEVLQPLVRPDAAETMREGVTPERIRRLATGLVERLKREPHDARGWVMLARSYTALGRYRDAVTAYGRAAELLPGDAGVLADQADALAAAQGRRLGGGPVRLVQQALDADPRHPKALALAGSAAFEAHDYAGACGYWTRAIAVLPPGSPMARSVAGSLHEAQRLEKADNRRP